MGLDYGLRWKLEESLMYLKQKYRLEETQLKNFEGIQSIFAVLMVEMYIIYKKIKALYFVAIGL